jgi:hypothetical protein
MNGAIISKSSSPTESIVYDSGNIAIDTHEDGFDYQMTIIT